MTDDETRALLEKVKSGELPIDAALTLLKGHKKRGRKIKSGSGIEPVSRKLRGRPKKSELRKQIAQEYRASGMGWLAGFADNDLKSYLEEKYFLSRKSVEGYLTEINKEQVNAGFEPSDVPRKMLMPPVIREHIEHAGRVECETALCLRLAADKHETFESDQASALVSYVLSLSDDALNSELCRLYPQYRGWSYDIVDLVNTKQLFVNKLKHACCMVRLELKRQRTPEKIPEK